MAELSDQLLLSHGAAGCVRHDQWMTIIKINAITVPRESGDDLAYRFAARAGAVDDADGFQGYELKSGHTSSPVGLTFFSIGCHADRPEMAELLGDDRPQPQLSMLNVLWPVIMKVGGPSSTVSQWPLGGQDHDP
jgi:hypothetical protein